MVAKEKEILVRTLVGIYVHKTYRKIGAHINCNIRMSCSSEFLLISILLNIDKALKHCNCWRIITNAYGQFIEMDEDRYGDHWI